MNSFFDDDTSACEVVPLILVKNDTYCVDPDTLKWLEAHNGDFSVVACAGKYRTGKSFLLNRLAQAPAGNGFGVGDTVQACTKGLWIYKKWFTTDSGKDVLLMDTEGIDALDADDTHDVRIFTLALLLSSMFMYNSVGALDETAMQTLSLMARVTNSVQISAETEANASELAAHMPHFVWVLRDFALRLTNKSGQTITTDEYLEEALQATDPNKDHVRASIREAFLHRKLITLPRPSSDDQQANFIEHRLFSISPRFVSAVDGLRKHLFDGAPPFMCQNVPASGRMYGALCAHLCRIVQSNAVPIIRDSWSLMASIQARDLKDELVREFRTTVENMAKKPPATIQTTLDKLVSETEQRFMTKVLPPIDPETKRVLSEELMREHAAAFEKLAKDVTEDAIRILDEVEEIIIAEPTTITTRLAKAEESFYSEFGRSSEVVRTWNATMTVKILRWFSKAVGMFAGKAEQAQLELSSQAEKSNSLQRELNTLKESVVQEYRVRESELQQLLESKDTELQSHKNARERATSDYASLHQEMRALESELHRLQEQQTDDDTALQVVPADDEALEELRLELCRAQADIASEKAALSVVKTQKDDIEQRLNAAAAIHAKLESSWKMGLEELRSSESKMHKLMEEKMQQETDEKERLSQRIDEKEQQIHCLEERVKNLLASTTSNNEMHDHEKQQLRDSVQRHREQCETAQQRVMEIHKNMLEDLRLRDERYRDQQDEYMKEKTEFMSRISELSHETERTKELLLGAKRRSNDLEQHERECKRLKSQHQTDCLAINRLEAENDQIKRMNTTMSDERERLRQENMQMEGELAVLRAEKQLNDAKRCITGGLT